jgi:hypothetical protein
MSDTNLKPELSAVFEQISAIFEQIRVSGVQDRAEMASIIMENPYIVSSIDDLRNNRFEKFHKAIVMKSDDILEGIVEHVFGDNYEIAFLIKQYDFLYQHLEKLFTKFEGHASCVDKTRTVLAYLLLNKAKGTRIEFDYDGEWTYHLPKKILTSHEEVIKFFDAMINLYYGSHEKYLALLLEVSGQSK